MFLEEIAEQSKVLLIKEQCEVKGELEVMNLFSRLKKSNGQARFKYNNKSILSKQGLFDDIVGFEDVKSLFEMAIKAERPVHPCNLC
jgi:hypothetical protein